MVKGQSGVPLKQHCSFTLATSQQGKSDLHPLKLAARTWEVRSCLHKRKFQADFIHKKIVIGCGAELQILSFSTPVVSFSPCVLFSKPSNPGIHPLLHILFVVLYRL